MTEKKIYTNLKQYLGEEGDNCVFKGAVLCANPWNLEICSLNLLRTWVGKEVYSKAMGSSMKELFERYVVLSFLYH